MPRFHARLYRQTGYFLSRWLCWRGRVRPARMYQNGRPVDPDFPATEKLYFRCMLNGISQTGQIKPTYIHFPDQSVNRERFGRPRDVLLPDGSKRSKTWILWGVAMILVGDLPPEMRTNGGITYSFTAEHDPWEDNYGHSELRVYKDGQRESDKKKINPHVKKEYRAKLALRTRVIVQPII